MKRIKYRLWSEYEKKYLPIWDYAIKGDGYIIDFLNGVNNTCQDELVEQYTGIKDKNGKEIYEGDIVRCILGDKPVEFRDCRYWLGETLDDLFVANLRYDIEVIGNIHEPPKDFRPEHLKRMGVTIEKGGEE